MFSSAEETHGRQKVMEGDPKDVQRIHYLTWILKDEKEKKKTISGSENSKRNDRSMNKNHILKELYVVQCFRNYLVEAILQCKELEFKCQKHTHQLITSVSSL